jgi:hypothetical protein
MPRDPRSELIRKIEAKRKSRVLCFVTGDRNPSPGQIGDDAVRPIYDHLRSFGRSARLDLFLYSRGGAIDVPWRIVSALRAASDEWNILIPFRANSAATLIALGADSIVMGQQGELGPIDPIMSLQRMMPGPGGQRTLVQDQINIEDVMAYVRFVQDRCGLSDQDALSLGLSKLVDRLDALVLGNVYRTHSHIRDVARRVLLSRKEPASEQTLATIVETLAERVYAHGHAIGLRTAKEIGLPAEPADAALDALMWDLLGEFESDLKLREPVDPLNAVSASDSYTEDFDIAVVQSRDMEHTFSGKLEVRAKRQIPSTLNVSVSLNLQMPAIDPQLMAQTQAVLQSILQQLQAEVTRQAQLAVQQALQQQAPIANIDVTFRDGRWKETSAAKKG